MVLQESVDRHAERIDMAVAIFESQISAEVEGIISVVSQHLFRSLSLDRTGAVEQTAMNSGIIRNVDMTLTQAINASDYFATAQSFVSDMSEQIDEFRSLYGEMQNSANLPDVKFVDEDKVILIDQAGSALSAIESAILLTMIDIRQLSSRYLGGIEVNPMAQGFSEAIRKLSKVGPIARDQLTIFFRLIGSLVYKNIELGGHNGLYKYVGPASDNTRPFCNKLAKDGLSWPHNDIDVLYNGQIAGVFENAGGFGCRHWWELVSLA